MANAEQKLKQGKKSSRGATGETVATSKTLESGAEPQRGEGARRGALAPRKRAKPGSAPHGKQSGGVSNNQAAAEDGAELLIKAADQQVKENCGKLSKLLADKALEGNISSARLLIMLAERKKPREEPVKRARRPSLAMRWAAEPKWEGNEEGNDE